MTTSFHPIDLTLKSDFHISFDQNFSGQTYARLWSCTRDFDFDWIQYSAATQNAQYQFLLKNIMVHSMNGKWKVRSPSPPLLWFSRWFALIAKTARNSWNPSLRKRNSRLHKSNHNFSFHCATAIHSFLLPLLLLSFHSFWLFLQTNIFQLNYSISADGIGSNLERSSFQIVHFNPITNLHPSIIDSQFQMKRIVFFSRRKNCMNLELYGYYWKHKRER